MIIILVSEIPNFTKNNLPWFDQSWDGDIRGSSNRLAHSHAALNPIYIVADESKMENVLQIPPILQITKFNSNSLLYKR